MKQWGDGLEWGDTQTGTPLQEVIAVLCPILEHWRSHRGRGQGCPRCKGMGRISPEDWAVNGLLISQNRHMPAKSDLGGGYWPTGTMPLVSLVLELKPCWEKKKWDQRLPVSFHGHVSCQIMKLLLGRARWSSSFPLSYSSEENMHLLPAAWCAQRYMSGPSPERIAGDLFSERCVKTGPTRWIRWGFSTTGDKNQPGEEARVEHFPVLRGSYDLIFFLLLFIASLSICQAPCMWQPNLDPGGTKMNMTQFREVSCCLIETRQRYVDELKYHIVHTLLEPWTQGATEEEPHLSVCRAQGEHTMMSMAEWFIQMLGSNIWFTGLYGNRKFLH